VQYYRHQAPAISIFIIHGPRKGSRILLLLIILKSFYILLSTTEIRHSDQNVTSLVTTMAFNLRKPIISIESKIDFKNLKTVKLQSSQQDGIAMKKIKVPITDGGSFKGVLNDL
jgi:ribosomal protein L24